MALPTKTSAALTAVVVLLGGQTPGSGAHTPPDPTDRGLTRLRADATAGLDVGRSPQGVVEFVGTPVGGSVVNPDVSAASGVRAAARAHLTRYGGALGLTDASRLVVTADVRSPSGQDVVRFQQRVGAAPVIGGQVVVSLRPDRQLASMLSTLSGVRRLPTATVTQGAARATAARAAARSAGVDQLVTTARGRAVWDPALFGARGTARGVWRFEVGDGAAVRRLVLVDDTTGRVLLDVDQVAHLDRVVCDRDNLPGDDTPCTSDFARVEGDPASGVPDVDAAYDHAGEVSDAYEQIAGLDLTELLGVDVEGESRLASTVRYCPTPGECPYPNAFWNGEQMFYGESYAVADDVVAHEMTHGVIDQYSELFYWGQSGALNESFADVIGEVVDHRAGLDAEDADWKLAEDLPDGALRDMKDPTSTGDPDRMTSPLWFADTETYGDGGGVHTNSGVGNKTAYLVSQGGTFNGQSMSGIDGDDTGLTKTGRLYVDALTRLTSGSDYADLAAVLEQSCADFVTSGTSGFTAADCDEVRKAVLATELRTTPTNAPQPADAVRACPPGSTMRELFSSESGDPATKLTSPTDLWSHGVQPGWGSNATSGRDSWFGWNPDPELGDPSSASLTATNGIALPAGQRSYLSFQQWRLFEWYPASDDAPVLHIDGGTVEVDAGAGPVDVAGLPWTNGPEQTLVAYDDTFPNEWEGTKAFGGDSFGWVRSQVDLTSYAGRTVRPSFTVRGDTELGYIGWWLDDITVHTCDVPPVVTPPLPPPAPATKLRSRTTLKVTTSGKVTLVAKVTVAGPRPTGKVRFTLKPATRAGRKITTSVRLKRGKATLVVKGRTKARLGSGKVKVKAVYSGSETVLPSTAKGSFRLR